jgi:hypothetical protein
MKRDGVARRWMLGMREVEYIGRRRSGAKSIVRGVRAAGPRPQRAGQRGRAHRRLGSRRAPGRGDRRVGAHGRCLAAARRSRVDMSGRALATAAAACSGVQRRAAPCSAVQRRAALCSTATPCRALQQQRHAVLCSSSAMQPCSTTAPCSGATCSSAALHTAAQRVPAAAAVATGAALCGSSGSSIREKRDSGGWCRAARRHSEVASRGHGAETDKQGSEGAEEGQRQKQQPRRQRRQPSRCWPAVRGRAWKR